MKVRPRRNPQWESMVPPDQRHHLVQAAELYGLEVGQLFDGSSASEAVQARNAGMRALRSQGWSYPKIAKLFATHHTTVIAAVKKGEQNIYEVSKNADHSEGFSAVSRSNLREFLG